jgi:archaellum biogenesis ATPase FlaH
MDGQLRHLLEVAELPHVRLQVLPFSAGGHMGVTNSFVMFSFPRTSDLDVVVVDHLTSSLYVDRKEDVAAYAAAFTRLSARALPREESTAMITAIRKELPAARCA